MFHCYVNVHISSKGFPDLGKYTALQSLRPCCGGKWFSMPQNSVYCNLIQTELIDVIKEHFNRFRYLSSDV